MAEVEPMPSLATLEKTLEETCSWVNQWQTGFQKHRQFLTSKPRVIQRDGFTLSVTKGKVTKRLGLLDVIEFERQKAQPGQLVFATLNYQAGMDDLRALSFAWYPQENYGNDGVIDERIILADGRITEIGQLALPPTFFLCGLDDPRLGVSFMQVLRVGLNYENGHLAGWQAELGFDSEVKERVIQAVYLDGDLVVDSDMEAGIDYGNGLLRLPAQLLFHFPRHLDLVPTLSNFGRHNTSH